MPKAFRKCALCHINSYNNPESVIFSINECSGQMFICEEHFSEEDIRPHGGSKRLRTGATPDWVGNVDVDHNYSTTTTTTSVPSKQVVELGGEEETEEEPYYDCSELEVASSQHSHTTNSQISDKLPSSSQSSEQQSSEFSWQPSSSQSSTDSQMSDIMDDLDTDKQDCADMSSNVSVIVMWSCLLQLLSKCRREGCGAAVNPDNMSLQRNGAALKVSLSCNEGHFEEWSSSEYIKTGRWSVPLINLAIICYSFVCGLHWEQLQAFLSQICILSVSSSTYYRYLNKIVYPFTYNSWLQNQADTIEEVLIQQEESGEGLKVAGDGRYDSPGWSAKFCTYFLQDLSTQKVIGFMVACKYQVKNSGAMEVFALKSLLNFFQRTGVSIKMIVTDRSTSVRAMIEVDFPEILHQFDVWHVIKNIKSKVYKASKLKSCTILKEWLKSVVNMLYWALDTAQGSHEMARQKFLSILHHTSGLHSFPSFNLFSKCAHGPIEQSKPWIPADSLAMSKLRKAICGKKDKNLEDLKYMTECCQTSLIESLNNLLLKYANKTFSYSWLSMLMRTCLACLDWNHNTNRTVKLDKSGHPVYKVKIDRSGNKSVVPVKAKKSYTWQKDIFASCVEGLRTGQIPQHQYPVVDEDTINKRGEFSKEEAIARLQSRMTMANEA